MKTEFQLWGFAGNDWRKTGYTRIIGRAPDCLPYVSFQVGNTLASLSEKEVERFAVNILKALKSKNLKP